MAGAGYKLFNTGDVLTAAQVNTYLMQQTVMVFADATARTTALSGVLAEGMISYLQDTNVTEVYNGSAWVGLAADQTPLTTKGDLFTYTTADARLGVGTNGQVLTADSTTATGLKWADAASGGMTLLSTTTLSGASTTISSINQTYKSLCIRLIDFDPSDNTGVTFRMRFNSDTTNSYSTRTANSSNESYSDAHINVAVNMSSTTVVSFAEIYIPEYANTNIRKTCTMLSHCANYFSTANMDFGWRFGVWDDTAAISEVTFYNSAGNWDGGTVYVYGVN